MAAAKTERLLNLVIALLSTRRALSRDAIRDAVAPYREAGSDEAFERMFERDKEELRQLGIPVITEDLDVLFEDEPGYRIDRGEYEVPELDLTAEQLSLLALAGRTWSQASLGGAAVRALRKMESAAAGQDDEDGDDLDETDRIETALPAPDAAFDVVKAAVMAARPVRFDYRRPQGATRTRRVQPWAIAAWHGHWYLTGYDVDRAEPRVFRLDRIVGEVTFDGAAGTYVIPEDHNPVAAIVASSAGGPPIRATLRVRPDRGHALRRKASSCTAAGEWDVVTVEHGDLASLADEIAGHGTDVVADTPAELREAVLQRLRAIRADHGGAR